MWNVLFFSIALVATVRADCPPVGFQTKASFNPLQFFSGTWYSVQQKVVSYQPLDSFYCVTAQYTVEKTRFCKIFGCDDVGVKVFNTARKGSVTGELEDASLYGVLKNPQDPSKASVGPRLLPSFTYGPYWVVEAGTFDALLAGSSFEGDKYEWALISGGAPEKETLNGCLPKKGLLFDGRGVWLFSRKPVISEEERQKLIEVARSFGYDITVLKVVQQEGCTYNNQVQQQQQN